MRSFPLLLVLLIACTSKQQTPQLSEHQAEFFALQKRYLRQYDSAENSITKNELKDKFLQDINSYFVDSLDYKLKGFKVKTNSVRTTELGKILALTANFSDDAHNEFWMEFDYPNTSQGKKDMESNPAYKFVKTLKEDQAAEVSFFYLGEVEYDYIFQNKLKIRVVPFSKDFNFDSSRAANKRKTE